MSRMANLDIVLGEMITAGQKMIDAAKELREMFSETTAPETKEPVKEEAPAPAPESKTYTFQEVRGIMAGLAGKGMKAEAKALLTKYGANRLSDVKEDDYSALVAEAEALLNG